jgi:hypothetical protein
MLQECLEKGVTVERDHYMTGIETALTVAEKWQAAHGSRCSHSPGMQWVCAFRVRVDTYLTGLGG